MACSLKLTSESMNQKCLRKLISAAAAAVGVSRKRSPLG